jgi:serine/threonine protein kinase
MENNSLADVLGRVNADNLPSFWIPAEIGIIVVGIVCGLEFIHWIEFVHRDLKSSNFLIDKDGRCYVTDLGSVRLLEGAARLSDEKSTIGYPVPELHDRDCNWKVDVFSFAMVLNGIVVGSAVYDSLSEEQTMYRAKTGTRAELPRAMSTEVKSLITGCWSGDPDRRSSFSDLLRDFERIEFKRLPCVDPVAVKRFVDEVLSEQKKK